MCAPSDIHLHQISFLQKHKVIIPHSLPASTFKLRTAGQRPPNRLVLSHRLIQLHNKLSLWYSAHPNFGMKKLTRVQKLRIISHTCACVCEPYLDHSCSVCIWNKFVTWKQSVDRHRYKTGLRKSSRWDLASFTFEGSQQVHASCGSGWLTDFFLPVQQAVPSQNYRIWLCSPWLLRPTRSFGFFLSSLSMWAGSTSSPQPE